MFKLVILVVVVVSVSGQGWVGAGDGWAAAGQGSLAQQGLAPQLAAPGIAAAPVLGAYNYRSLSLAPGQPANILAADGRPLDTLSVNLDRAAHYTARALDHAGRILHKRSAVLPVAPVVWSRTAGLTIPIAAPLVATPLAAPLGGPWGHTGGVAAY